MTKAKKSKKKSKPQTENRFMLSVAVVKRSKQLCEGVKPLLDKEETEGLTAIEIALKEIEAHEVKIQFIEDVETQEGMIDEMDQILDTELEEKEEKDSKKPSKDSKKSKSLAA